MATDGAAGMVAVVRGLQDAGLAVTLYDNGKEFTLAPNTFGQQTQSRNKVVHMASPHEHVSHHRTSPNVPVQYPQNRQAPAPLLRTTATDTIPPNPVKSNAGVQAVDGRYASVYQATIGKMKPTNPSPQLTEFPPQRPDVCRGCSNFIVGGTGSGDTRHKSMHSPHYRGGGMTWPDKESVCSPRPSAQPDAFVKSLRRYPRMSPERSTEIVERLINYTQAKNFGNAKSPTRQGSTAQDHCEQTETIRCRSPTKRACFEPCRLRTSDESPTRDRPKHGESEPFEVKKTPYFKNYDVKHLREVSKAIKDNITNANLSNFPVTQYSAPQRQQLQRHDRSPVTRRGVLEQHRNNCPCMVHSEIQAAVTMVCREVETISKLEPETRDIKVPCSDAEQASEGQVSVPIHTQVQTTLSVIEISSGKLVLDARKSRSTEEIGNKGEKQKLIIEKLKEELLTNERRCLQNRTKKIESIKIDNNIVDNQSERFPMNIPLRNRNIQPYRRGIYKDSANLRSFEARHYDMFRAEISLTPKSYILKAVRSWLNNIPIRNHGFLGRRLKREHILYDVVRRIKMIPLRVQLDKKKFRTEMLEIISDVPFDTGCGNRKLYLKTITEELITKLEFARINNARSDRSTPLRLFTNRYIVNTATNSKRFVRPSEEEIRNFVQQELVDAIHKSHLDFNTSGAKEVEDELVDVLHDSLEDVDSGREKIVIEEIVSTLEEIGKILRFQATYFAAMLMNNFKRRFYNTDNVDGNKDHYEGLGNENALVSKQSRGTSNTEAINFKNKYVEASSSNEKMIISVDCKRDAECDTKINIVIETYTNHLSKKIEKWLNDIETDIPQIRNCAFRQIIVKELVNDIIDRQKYLKLNPTSHICDRDELEHLKYQIFKWIYKVVGDKNMTILEKAPNLMELIKNVPVPTFLKRRKIWQQNINDSNNLDISVKPLHQNNEKNLETTSKMVSSVFTMTTDQVSAFGVTNAGTSLEGFPKQSNSAVDQFTENSAGDIPEAVFTYTRKQNSPKPIMMAVQDSIGRISPGRPSPEPVSSRHLAPPPVQSIEKMNQEFIEFLSDWVNSIPLPPNTPQEREIRQGFFQGIMQAIAKLKSSPVICGNPLYYEDALDDEIENLFSLLPQSDELTSKRHHLKVQLITKNCALNEKIKRCIAPETFGHQLRQGLSVYVPKIETNEKEENKVRLFEELKILFFVEEYIMFLRYREEDEMKANVYKTKLMRRIQEFVRDLKQIHNAELKDIDDKAYMEDILAAMEKVPLPSDETIKQEADEIMLGMEIDKWFSDLPLIANDDLLEQLKRRRLRDQLAKKVYDMEKNLNLADETGEMALRHEVSQVLEKLPMERDESLNINFMVDELTNRIKNRQRDPSGRRKVGFDEAIEYGQFSAQVPGSSSPTNPGNQQLSRTLGRWVNVPGTSMVVNEEQAMKDPAGRTRTTFEEKPIFAPFLQQQQTTQSNLPGSLTSSPHTGAQVANNSYLPGHEGLHLAGAAHKSTQYHTLEVTKAPPGMWDSQSHLSPKPPSQPTQSVYQQIPQQPSLPTVQSQAQSYGPAQIYAPSPGFALPPSYGPTPIYAPTGPPPGQIFGPTNYAGPSQLDTSVGYGDRSLWLNKAVQDYEDKHPSLTAIDTSFQFGPRHPGIVQNISQLNPNQAPPASSSLKLNSHTSRRENFSRSQRRPQEQEENKDAGWPYTLANHGENTSRKGAGPQQNVSRSQQKATQENLGDQYFSLGVTKAPPGMWGSQRSESPRLISQPVQTPYPVAADQALKDFAGQPVKVAPAQEATGTMWLSKYVRDYVADHPPVNTPPPRTSQLAPNLNSSLRVPPQNMTILPAPEYNAFDQERPVSSSFYHQQIEQTLGGQAFQRSKATPHSQNLDQTNTSRLISPPLHVSVGGIDISRPGVPQRSIQVQSSAPSPPPVSSAALQAPDFYNSTNREGIQIFTDHSRNTDRANASSGIQQAPSTPIGPVPQQQPGTQPSVTQQGVQTPKLAFQQTSRWALPAPYPFLPPPLPPDWSPESGRPSGEDSEGRCKCLEKIEKMRKMGLCRKCNMELSHPMRFFAPPCPWYF